MMWNLFICAYLIGGACQYTKEAQHESLQSCVDDARISSEVASTMGYPTISICSPLRQEVFFNKETKTLDIRQVKEKI